MTMNLPEQAQHYWQQQAQELVAWQTPWHCLVSGDMARGQVQWFLGGKLNVSANCIDKHLPHKAQHPAIIWEGDDSSQQRRLSFQDLYDEVCRMANVLQSLGLKRGDTVAIYLPMIPEAAIAMLACTRIGLIHTVVFAGFSAAALRQRLEASACKLLITADGYQRGGKTYALKVQADEASAGLAIKTLIIQHSAQSIHFDPNSNYWWHELKLKVKADCPPLAMDAEDPLFILYTSGSTGKPKGLVHTTGGYLVQAASSYRHIFKCNHSDIFWCTADVGWITGHSYVVYGPLCNGITTLMYSGLPNWPDASRCWQIIDRYQVNVFYTAPTAIRALKRARDEWLNSSSRNSLRLLGTVGEPINPEVWLWYKQQVGLDRCPIVDTWWQTETGAAMICPPSATGVEKPGAACQPLPGIYPILLDEAGQEISGSGEGSLAIKYPWPSMARTIAGDHARYCATYLKNGYYITGDGARRDEDGDYWITGRLDDVLNVAGHRLGTAEIESALVAHPQVAEAAAVGIPHALKGQGIYVFVSLKGGCQPSQQLHNELIEQVKNSIGAIAKPDVVQWVSDLPKTRSGKIMRRILRQIACNNATSLDDLGDLSTLSNPQVVDELMQISLLPASGRREN